MHLSTKSIRLLHFPQNRLTNIQPIDARSKPRNSSVDECVCSEFDVSTSIAAGLPYALHAVIACDSSKAGAVVCYTLSRICLDISSASIV